MYTSLMCFRFCLMLKLTESQLCMRKTLRAICSRISTAWAIGKTRIVVAVLLSNVEAIQLANAKPAIRFHGLPPRISRSKCAARRCSRTRSNAMARRNDPIRTNWVSLKYERATRKPSATPKTGNRTSGRRAVAETRK
jgi:hypothetical protein